MLHFSTPIVRQACRLSSGAVCEANASHTARDQLHIFVICVASKRQLLPLDAYQLSEDRSLNDLIMF
jgi:hypothetical protein